MNKPKIHQQSKTIIKLQPMPISDLWKICILQGKKRKKKTNLFTTIQSAKGYWIMTERYRKMQKNK